MKVVLDANVFISALMKEGSVPYKAVKKALSDFETIVPQQFVNDIYSFALQAKKKKVKINPDDFIVIVAELEKSGLIKIVKVKGIVDISRHKADNHYISAALENGAKVLITGDKDLTCEETVKRCLELGIRIVKPVEFVEMF